MLVLPLPKTEGPLSAALARVAPQGEVIVAVEDPFPRPLSAASFKELVRVSGRIVAHDGTVTALVPPTRTALFLPKTAPDVKAGYGQPEAFVALVASLDTAQVNALASRSGLTLGALRSDEQRDLFQAVVAPGGVPAIQTPETGMHPAKTSGLYTYTPPDTSKEWRSAHLSLGEGVHLGVPSADGRNVEAIELFENTVFPAPDDPQRMYGVEATKKVPNLPRPGALPLGAAWTSKTVGLSGLSTVGDLFSRVRTVTGKEILADARLAARGLAVSGKSASAGDILVAVAHAFGGTYRAVGPALLLTDDEIGLGSRASAWGRLITEGEAGAAKFRDAYMPEARRRLAGISLPGVDDLALTPAQRAKLQGYDRRSGRGYGTFDSAELTPAQRDRINALLAVPPRQSSVIRRTDGSATVLIQREVVVRYSGFDGVVGLPALLDVLPPSDEPTPPSVSPAPRLTEATTVALPLGLPNLLETLQTAKRIGLAGVWIVVPPDELRSDRLVKALQSAKSLALPICVGIRPFDLTSGAEPDRDIEGRPATVRPPSVRALSALGGAAAALHVDVVLLDTAPNGYGPMEHSGRPTTPLGYTMEARLGFLRAHGYDPIDLVSGGVPMRMNVAFSETALSYGVQDTQSMADVLEKSRQGANLAALRAFRSAYPGRLLVETRQPFPFLDPIFEWPLGEDFPSGGSQICSRIVVPNLTKAEEASVPAASTSRPIVLDLTAWKMPVDGFLRGLFRGEKVPLG